MTADVEQKESQPPEEINNVNNNFPAEIDNIFEHLCHQQKIIFKSQQIDDPELEPSEKKQIAKSIYEQNRQTFLRRFGSYMTQEHLKSFARLAISDGSKPLKQEESYEEMQYMLHDFERRLKTRCKDIKNRRYARMQQLIKQGEYFSELEMMKRQPELYQELVGQYLNEDEKKQRDGYDVRNTSFSGILMHSLEQQQRDEALAAAEASLEKENPEIELESKQAAEFEAISEAIPSSFRQQWGNFENEPVVACSSSKNSAMSSKTNDKRQSKPRKEPKFITAGERDILRQEFLGIVYEQFLAGEDKDFDYTQVDEDSQLDDLQQLNQDKEDEYFEQSDDEPSPEISRDEAEGLKDDSEDELDIYMSHLSKHHSLQK